MTGAGAVEPMRFLDERYLASPFAMASDPITTTAWVRGDGLRDADGAVRMALVREHLERAITGIPRLRQVVRRFPLGLMVPAWVHADRMDYDHHVRLHPGRFAPDDVPAAVLAGAANPPFDERRPLWSALVIDLTDGGLVVVIAGHHAIGDGIAALGMVLGMLPGRPGIADVDGGRPAAAPRTPLGLAVGAVHASAERHGGVGAAFADYRAKPVVQRVRRMGGRILRRPRRRLSRPVVPLREYAMRTVPVGECRALARSMGVGLNDLVVTATARVAAAGGLAPALLVPIADPRDRARGGNAVRVARVPVDADAPLGRAAAGVKAAIEASLAAPAPVAGPTSGYATTLYGPPRRRYLVDAPVERLMLWPRIDGGEHVGALAFTYGGLLTVGVVTDGSVRAEALADGIADLLRVEVAA